MNGVLKKYDSSLIVRICSNWCDKEMGTINHIFVEKAGLVVRSQLLCKTLSSATNPHQPYDCECVTGRWGLLIRMLCSLVSARALKESYFDGHVVDKQ